MEREKDYNKYFCSVEPCIQGKKIKLKSESTNNEVSFQVDVPIAYCSDMDISTAISHQNVAPFDITPMRTEHCDDITLQNNTNKLECDLVMDVNRQVDVPVSQGSKSTKDQSIINYDTCRTTDISHISTSPILNHACPECDLRFVNTADLRQHMFTHKGDEHHTCLHCDQMFVLSSDLKQHMLKHIGIKRHACPECDKRFIRTATLKTHMLTHSGEKLHSESTTTNEVSFDTYENEKNDQTGSFNALSIKKEFLGIINKQQYYENYVCADNNLYIESLPITEYIKTEADDLSSTPNSSLY